MWTTVIVIAIVVAILGGAIAYIIRAKKKGVKCIGCPAGSSCSGHCCSGSKPTTPEQEPVQAEAVSPNVDIAPTADNTATAHTCDCSSCSSSCPSNNSTEED